MNFVTMFLATVAAFTFISYDADGVNGLPVVGGDQTITRDELPPPAPPKGDISIGES